jgi:3-dehydroquinate synthase
VSHLPHPESRDPASGSGRGGEPVDASFAVAFTHRIRFTRDVFDPGNHVLRDVLAAGPDSSGRSVVFVDDGVSAAWPGLADDIERYASRHDEVLRLGSPVRVVPGGEPAKNGGLVHNTVTAVINEAGICRHSYVIAIGGGAMLDAVGYAAATAHRGVRLIRLPTTTLGQGDAGIGVKNGINAYGKKNFIGTFSVPWAVVNDERFLVTLSDRDWRSGLSEAVKVALLKDAPFFHRIMQLTPALRDGDGAAAGPVIRRSAELHLEHIASGGDPFELLNARPLDFGHWAAHKLEEMSSFRIKHGEAVAIGLALDVVYAELMKMLPPAETRAILECLHGIGFALHDPLADDHATLLDGLEEFREHLGGRLTITLLEGIGRPVDVHEIDRACMIEAIARLAERAAAMDAETA